MNRPALSVRGLRVTLTTGNRRSTVVDGIDFDLQAGEVLALLGESGCGKTKTAEAIMGLLPGDTASCSAECLMLGTTRLDTLGERGMRRVRGREISMVFQEPLTALDPVFTTGQQLAAIYRRHRAQKREEARESAVAMLKTVGLADVNRIMSSYPHQLSGGMRQRIMLGMAMACRPRVLIADEATTALDVTTQAQVLSRMTSLCREAGTAILLITHDLGVVAQYCDRALVMRRGRIVEQAAVPSLFSAPQADYTAELVAIAHRMTVR